jgi:cobalt-zinc-cadmium efflux system membrane fusion protein
VKTLSQLARAAAALAAFTAVAACGAHSPESSLGASEHTPAEHAGGAGPREVTVSDGMLASIKVDSVRETSAPPTLGAAAKVQFDEDRVARVLAPLSGQIVDLRVKVGDAVRKGQALCAINSREVAAAVGEHIEAHRDLELAEKTAAMTEDLFEHQASSRMALQQAQSDLAKARARIERTEESLRVLGLRPDDPSAEKLDGRIPIVASISGTVIERRITEGQFVQPDATPMIVVADLSNVWVVGDVVERDLHLVALGDRAAVTTAAYPGEEFHGRVSYISDVIDPATRTAKVRIAVPNRNNRLKPEMFASIALAGTVDTRLIAVPSSAIFFEDGRAWVYVATGPRRFVRRAIDVAEEDGGRRRVRGGLDAGDQVVVAGALLLRNEEEKAGA